ncbi:MAG: mechanosensitive channel MscK [Alcanivorax sp.]|nr:mechanosensitive channel MscK [Alcanivorax sp.]
MDRRGGLPFLLILLLLPLLASAQTAGLPSISNLEKQLNDSQQLPGQSDSNPAGNQQPLSSRQQELQKAISFRREIDDNTKQIEALKKETGQAPVTLAKLDRDLQSQHKDLQEDWNKHYDSEDLDSLVNTLIKQLNLLEKNQSDLAEVNGVLTHEQTLPEHAQDDISAALSRMDEIRPLLNGGSKQEPLTPAREQRLTTEMQALQSRIDLRNQELSASGKRQEVARLRKRILEAQEKLIEQKLNALQPLINQRRANRLKEQEDRSGKTLPEEVRQNPQVNKALTLNRSLRQQLNSLSEDVNDLLREAINTKTRLDKARSLSSTVNDQIRMLDGSLLLSRVLYEQQKSLPKVSRDDELSKEISDTRLAQFEVNQQRQALSAATQPSQSADGQPLSDKVRDTLSLIRSDRLELYSQLDQELGRKLTILVRTQLNQKQLRNIAETLHNTISEQTFWMPSTQPVTFKWLGQLPAQIGQQFQSIPWQKIFADSLSLLKSKWPWLLLMLAPSLLLLLRRPAIRKRLDALNHDVGFLRRDSQGHTPMAIGFSALLAAPGPLLVALLGAGLWLQPQTLTTVFGAALAKIALLWLVIELAYRLLAQNGIAQRHFRWDAAHNQQMRRRLLATGIATVPMTLIIAFGEQWPAQLSNDRIGLLMVMGSLLVIAVMLPRAAHAYSSRNYSRALRNLVVTACALAPLVLVGLIGIGYYYTAVRLSGRMIDSLYLLMLWVLVDATAMRGLAVAAQRLAYRRAVAQRQAEAKESNSSEAVEVEEPKMDLKQVNQQSLRLIRLALIAGAAVLLYWVWSDILHAFSYTENIVLWQTSQGTGVAADMVPISLGDVITALAVGMITFLLASNLPGLLEVLVLSRLDLRQGTSYATTTLLSYVIVASGTVLTLGTLGLSWNKLQWLVAALGVGLGFGLQEIFANFISGIIILFERPIRIGDVITIGNLDGTVSRIRIRATTIIDFDRKEIIVPNKVFVTERLINWSLSDTVTRLVLKIGFAYGSDLQKCRDILLKAARDNRRILRDPEPVVFFMGFGASTLDHELRVHVSDISDRLAATDELNRHIDTMCREQGVEIAFSQLDIHIRRDNGEQLCIEQKKPAPPQNDGNQDDSGKD